MSEPPSKKRKLHHQQSNSLPIHPMPSPLSFAINRTRASWKREDGTINFVDLLRADEPKELQRVVMSSYGFDLEWLFTDIHNPYAPASILHKVKEVVFVHGSDDTQQSYAKLAKQSEDDVVEIDPKEPKHHEMIRSKQLKFHKTPLPIEYGTMHGKIMLLYYADCVRVAITTANLLEHDWTNLIQGIWTQVFPLQSGKKEANDFETTLIDFVRRMKLEDDAKRLAKYDFSSAKVALITSVPGYHKYKDLHKYGHMKIRKLLAERCKLDPSIKYSNLVCLFSSVGSLHEKWLTDEFQGSFMRCTDYKPEQTNSTSKTKSKVTLSSTPRHPALVWPTHEEVKKSYLGLRAAGHYCFAEKNNKKFMKSMYHKWQPFPSYRDRMLSHAKLYTRYAIVENKTTEEKEIQLPWVLLTSSNLSKAAWGHLIHNGNTLMIRAFEIGVLFLPEVVNNQLQTFVAAEKPREVKDANNQVVRVEFPIPFSLPIVPYSKEDEPYLS